ncbi:MAG: NPCBM/NEW2 domain-containing protein [Coprococcus sp.]
MDEFYKDSDIHKWAGIDKDNTGTSYSSGILLSESGGYMFSDSESSEIEYLLGGKYDKLSGKVVLHYDCKDNAESSAAGKVKIYGDGELLYSSDVVKSGVLPQNFDLNITGVNRLKIEFIWMLTPYGFDMGQIEIGVVTPIVQKSYMSKK